MSRFNPGGSAQFEDAFFQIIILCRKITISPQPNIQLTLDKSVILSLSVEAKQKKNRGLYLSQINRGDPTKLEDTFFQKTIFDKITDFSKNFQGKDLKATGLIL